MFSIFIHAPPPQAAKLSTDPIFLSIMTFLTDKLINDFEFFSLRTIGNTAFTLGKLKLRNKPFLCALSNVRNKFVFQADPQCLSSVAHYCAVVNHRSKELMVAIASVGERLMNGNSLDIAYTLWAFTTLNYKAPLIFQALETNLASVVNNGNAVSLIMLVWSYAKVKRKCDELYRLVAVHCERIVATAPIESLVDLAWAYASNNSYKNPAMFEAVGKVKMNHYSTTLKHAASLAWSMAHVGHDARAFFMAIIDKKIWLVAVTGSRIEELASAQERESRRRADCKSLSMLAFSFAKIGLFSSELFKGISSVAFSSANKAASLTEDFTGEENCNLLWSYAIAGMINIVTIDFLKQLWRNPIKRTTMNITHTCLQQMYLFYISSSVIAPSLCNFHRPPTEMWNAIKFAGGKISEHRNRRDKRAIGKIRKLLEKMNLPVKRNVSPWIDNFDAEINENFLITDLFARGQSQRKIAIEFDSNNRLAYPEVGSGSVTKPNGATKFKARILKALGFEIFNISSELWYQLNEEDEEEEEKEDGDGGEEEERNAEAEGEEGEGEEDISNALISKRIEFLREQLKLQQKEKQKQKGIFLT